jgi:hypothetical protein
MAQETDRKKKFRVLHRVSNQGTWQNSLYAFRTEAVLKDAEFLQAQAMYICPSVWRTKVVEMCSAEEADMQEYLAISDI